MDNVSSPEISRRGFLTQAGLGLAAVSTMNPVGAQVPTVGPKIRLGLIGCGKRGQWLAGHFAAHGGHEIVGVADYFEAAVAAGLHVYLAKPVAVDVPGCQSIAASGAAARKKGQVFLVDFQTRTNGVLLTAYGGDVMIRGGAATFYRGGKTGGIYQEGAIANIKAFHAQVVAKDATNATLEPSVTSTLVSIMGRIAAYEGRPVTRRASGSTANISACGFRKTPERRRCQANPPP